MKHVNALRWRAALLDTQGVQGLGRVELGGPEGASPGPRGTSFSLLEPS